MGSIKVLIGQHIRRAKLQNRDLGAVARCHESGLGEGGVGGGGMAAFSSRLMRM
jgi:hypothetical protein